MQARRKLRRFTALLLSALLALTCMPVGVMAEAPESPAETSDITVEVIPEIPGEGSPDETGSEAEPAAAEASDDAGPDSDTLAPEAEPSRADENLPESDPADGMADSTDDAAAESADDPAGPEETQPDDGPENTDALQDLNPATDEAATEEAEVSEQEPVDDLEESVHPLKAAIEANGHVYVTTVRSVRVFSDPALHKDTLVYTVTHDASLLLATDYTKYDTVKVWFLDEDGAVVTGYAAANDLNHQYVPDSDLAGMDDLPSAEGMTSLGLMRLFVVYGSHPAVEEPAMQTTESEEAVEETAEGSAEASEESNPVQESSEVIGSEETSEPEPATIQDEETDFSDSGELTEEAPEPMEPVEEQPVPETDPEAEEPVHALPGDYLSVTTKTRVFSGMDLQATETVYSGSYLGHFVKDATVQVMSVHFDENGGIWYQVQYLFGDRLADGSLKWTDTGSAWIMADETAPSAEESCSVTDFAYTLEYLRMTRGSRLRLRSASPMNGFSLKNISGSVGAFYAGQSGLNGSSGRDKAYPQLAKSAAHGLIYATPHMLEGYTVYCLEHNLNGPGEGSGSSQSPTGPYVLVDMDSFVNDPANGGTTGVRYRAETMHAIGWVLRHSYPFMALDRTDANNETWSRVAGQFAIREVIKQMEGPQYVRDYWDMDSFYSFTGGAPAVYLTYARWLAENAIAHGRVSGDIYADKQSMIMSNGQYVGSVTLTTDADLIRIPRSVGSLTGNSAGADNDYYYLKSGDTISVTTADSSFSLPMESVASADEEARFLVGIPSAVIQKVLVPVYGSPYAYKSGSLKFELNLGELVVVKRGSDGGFLEDALFELLDESGHVIATARTGYDGQASFTGLEAGNYTVREVEAPVGYHLSATPTRGVTVTAGSVTVEQITNDPIRGRIRIVKTDSVSGKPLPGATFTVTRLSVAPSLGTYGVGEVVAVITTNEQGIAETDLLTWGEYRIDETGVPEGYLDAGYTATVWIK